MRRRALVLATAVTTLAWSPALTAPATAATTTVQLSGLYWQSNSQGYSYTHLNRNIDNGPLVVGGTKYLTGLGAHSDFETVYDLAGAATRFQSVVGLSTQAGVTAGTVVFQVFKDGTKVFDSGVLKRSSAARSVDVDLTGAQKLRLVVTDAGDGNTSDEANWAAARLTVTQGAPLPAASAPVGDIGDPANPKGDPYDSTVNHYPERPYVRDYTRTPFTKMFLAEKDATDPSNKSKVYRTFAQALDDIRKLDNLMLGADRIVYLVGWQYEGHDSKYPAWAAVNEDLKRPEDATALESLRWLMREAKKYHTTVSLHVNMFDAYQDSPLWDAYLADDIVAKDTAGNPIPGKVWSGQTSYAISYRQEWLKGRSKTRIDALLAMVPELRQAGTLHIDAFHQVDPNRLNQVISPYLGFTREQETAAQRTVLRYWRSQGVDVTTEFDRSSNYKPDAHLGLEPASWHSSLTGNAPYLRSTTPLGGAENHLKQQDWNGVEQDAVRAFPQWFYRNSTSREVGTEGHGTADDTFFPALWQDRLIAAYSTNGYASRTWTLPPGWTGVTSVGLYDVTAEGPVWVRNLPVTNGTVAFGLGAGKGAALMPAVAAGSSAPVGRTVSLKAASNGKQVAAHTDLTDSPLQATGATVGDTEKFDVVDAGGGLVALKARSTGKYAVAWANRAGNPLLANSTAVGAWEKFRWVDLGNGKAALQALSSGRYVTVRGDEPDAALRASGWSVGNWEQFTWSAA
ncbi:NPCBM/NEW2 domain-containing protein [Kitasatospora purpeofusca]|uniref:NPCBM/NEW2 domain-containing protein n=1 Tax=Kitasatospora purpeofusca TaxID=67352 RepID=UPI00365BD7A0